MQTRWESILEIMLNTTTGFIISWAVTLWVLPMFGHAVSYSQGFHITSIFTLISILRSYICRRAFNFKIAKRVQ